MTRRFLRLSALLVAAGAVCVLSLQQSSGHAPAGSKAQPAPAATKANRLPEIEDLAITDWVVGKELHFGIHALDPDDDGVRIELVAKPASATYNALTQTVSWKPTAKDGVEGRFRVRVTELQPGAAQAGNRIVTRDFAIRLGKGKAALPLPQVLSPAQEMLITIHDPARLAEVKKSWSLGKLLSHVGNLEIAREVRAGKKAADYAVPKPEAQLDVILGLMAKLHKNPALDPASDKFDKRWKLPNWDLVTIRPRMNKKRHELRVVYKNMAAPETNYIMFRLALASDMPDVPMDVRKESNQEFSRLFYEAFFTGDALNPKLVTDKKAYAKALNGFVAAVLNYKSDAHPKLFSQMLALPNAGRLGGGSVVDGKGEYQQGNGWAWLTFKNTWVAEGDKQMASYFGPPIKGFSGEIAIDNGAYVSKCIPELDVSLCRQAEGFTNMPAVEPVVKNADGTVKAALLDAQHTNPEYKRLMVKKTALDDATRRNFEENGMSCAQCHVRRFDEGNVLDPGLFDPSKKQGGAAARPLPQTFFVLVPELKHSPFLAAQARDAECQLGPTLAADTGKQVNVPCPHRAE